MIVYKKLLSVENCNKNDKVGKKK